MNIPTVFQEPGLKSPEELVAVADDFGESSATVLVGNDVATDT